jgi:protein AbiQ
MAFFICYKEYCIPLSSPKEKHLKMKNDIDFHKILDDKGKIIGVLDINNMIPVRKDLLKRVDISNKPGDLPETKRYKELVSNQLNYCRKNQDIIIKKANKLYKMTKNKKVSKQLKHRCLNWEKLESILDRFQ